jgi:signal recognition particle receptor subunit beta
MTTPVDHITILFLGGMFGCGKSQMIRAISGIEPISTEFPNELPRDGTQIALDFGQLTLADDLSVYFLGQPGARRMPPFDKIPPRLMQRVGILFVVDSARKAYSADERDPFLLYRPEFYELRAVAETNYPYIVLANKQDKPDARSPQQIRRILSLSPHTLVLPTSATTDPASIKRAVLALLKLMPQDDVVKTAIEKFPPV